MILGMTIEFENCNKTDVNRTLRSVVLVGSLEGSNISWDGQRAFHMLTVGVSLNRLVVVASSAS